jgi:hypothetical protein
VGFATAHVVAFPSPILFFAPLRLGVRFILEFFSKENLANRAAPGKIVVGSGK